MTNVSPVESSNDEIRAEFHAAAARVADSQTARLVAACGGTVSDELSHAFRQIVWKCDSDTVASLAASLTEMNRPHNFTDGSARIFAKTLDSDDQWTLSEALREIREGDLDSQITSEILEVIKKRHVEGAPQAVAVIFHTMDYENGHYLTEDGTVYYADGSTDQFEFGISDELTDAYGCVGSDFAFGMNLLTGETDSDDYAGNVMRAIGIPDKS